MTTADAQPDETDGAATGGSSGGARQIGPASAFGGDRPVFEALNRTVETAFSALAEIRHGRALHTRGLLCRGHCTIEGETLPLRSGEVLVRISKGLGMPGPIPDIVGVAVRLPAGAGIGLVESPHWDLLMSGPMQRIGPVPLPRPAWSWNGVQVSTGTAFRYGSQEWRIDARLLVPGEIEGLSLAALAESLAIGGGLSLQTTIDDARHTPLGFIELTAAEPDSAIEFDPIGSTPAGVEPVPNWLNEIRRSAYRGSRRGREQA